MSGLPVGELVGAAACLLLGSLVAGAEAAVVSLPEARMRALHDEIGASGRAQLARYLADPTKVLSRLLAFRVMALIIASVLATNAVCRGREAPYLLLLLIVVLTLAYGLLAELFSTLGRARGRSLASIALTITEPLELLMVPLAAPLAILGRAIQRRAQTQLPSDPPAVSERELEHLVEEAESSGALDARRGELMQNVLELKDVRARDVMVPRTRMHAIEAQTSLERAHAMLAEEGHSRVPVYRGQIDNIVGVLHAKDLFRHLLDAPALPISTPPSVAGTSSRPPPGASERPPRPATVDAVARKPAFFVSESQSALEVLREMQARQTHMAMVVDEFGSVAGLVTLEDILEELVGEIRDEHDAEEPVIVNLGDGRYLASAAIAIAELGEHLGVELPEAETYASLGGFLADRAGKVPVLGTVVRWNGLTFTVKEGDARRASMVEILRGRDSAKPATDPSHASDESH